jgi:hypothetical protein
VFDVLKNKRHSYIYIVFDIKASFGNVKLRAEVIIHKDNPYARCISE